MRPALSFILTTASATALLTEVGVTAASVAPCGLQMSMDLRSAVWPRNRIGVFGCFSLTRGWVTVARTQPAGNLPVGVCAAAIPVPIARPTTVATNEDMSLRMMAL